jgi:hypothetical protein
VIRWNLSLNLNEGGHGRRMSEGKDRALKKMNCWPYVTIRELLTMNPLIKIQQESQDATRTSTNKVVEFCRTRIDELDKIPGLNVE